MSASKLKLYWRLQLAAHFLQKQADRDLLKDTLDVVKRFKTLLRQRFHLDAL